MLRIAHQIEKVNAPIETNFSSNPCNGNTANPPTMPKTAESDVVHAGHPWCELPLKAPPNIALVPFFHILVSLCFDIVCN